MSGLGSTGNAWEAESFVNVSCTVTTGASEMGSVPDIALLEHEDLRKIFKVQV